MPQQPPSIALPPPVRRLLEERLTGGDLELPVLPSSSSEVMALCNDETCDAFKLAEALQRDQSLAAHVLRVANSAAYAPKEPIVSLQQAVSRLGIPTVCEIAVAVSLQGREFHVPGHQVRVRQMWIHSAAAALFAKEVARRVRRNVEGAFICGLLHDVGKPLVMLALMDIAKGRTDRPVPVPILEAASTEFHERMGAMLAQSWKLPDWMAEAIGYHHRYEHTPQYKEEAMITALADSLAHWAVDEELGEADFEAEAAVVADLNLYADDLVELLRFRDRVLEIAESFFS